MNLEELSKQIKVIENQFPSFGDMDNILNNSIKAIEFGQYYIEEGCSKCTNGKVKIKSNYYPGYTTMDCECTINNKHLNNSLKHLTHIDSRELLKYDYRLYAGSRPGKEFLYNLVTKDTKKWFYLYGPSGLGKTYSAYMMLYMYSLNYTVFTSSLQAILDSSRPNNLIQGGLYKKCEITEVLLVDDLDNLIISEWAINKFFELINIRDKKNLITIFTSNHGFNNIPILQNEALKSRFMGNCKQIKLSGEDLRVNN